MQTIFFKRDDIKDVELHILLLFFSQTNQKKITCYLDGRSI